MQEVATIQDRQCELRFQGVQCGPSASPHPHGGLDQLEQIALILRSIGIICPRPSQRAGHFAPLQTIPHHHSQLTQTLVNYPIVGPPCLNTAEDHNCPKLQEAHKFLAI